MFYPDKWFIHPLDLSTFYPLVNLSTCFIHLLYPPLDLSTGWLVGNMLGTTAIHRMQPDISTTILDKCQKGKSHTTPQHEGAVHDLNS